MDRTIALIAMCALTLSVANGVRAQNRSTGTRGVAAKDERLPEGVTSREVRFYSEGIACFGRIFTPVGFSTESKLPAVVLAPDWGETAGSIERRAAALAARSIVAMVFDYRGWGKSGGFLQTATDVKTDDRLRFSQMTAKVRITRKRLIPNQQVLDIRNALYYLQGEPGVDRARVGVWGAGMAGGHAIVIAATDSRIKAVVAQTPMIEGKSTPKRAWAPTGDLLRAELSRARTSPPASGNGTTAAANHETSLALAEYHPFWNVDQIPATVAVLFVVAERDTTVDNSNNAIAASRLVKGPTNVISIAKTTHTGINVGAAFDQSLNAAAEWFLKHL